MFDLTPERPEDGPAIETLLDHAFGPERRSKISYRFRAGVAPIAELSRVARASDDGRLLGAIRYWPIQIASASALLLGPLAVEPALKGQGIGQALMRDTLDAAAWANAQRVVLVGDLGYYRRFGFVPAAPHGLVMPGEQPARLLMLALTPGAFAGVSGAIMPWRMPRGSWRAAA